MKISLDTGPYGVFNTKLSFPKNGKNIIDGIVLASERIPKIVRDDIEAIGAKPRSDFNEANCIAEIEIVLRTEDQKDKMENRIKRPVVQLFSKEEVADMVFNMVYCLLKIRKDSSSNLSKKIQQQLSALGTSNILAKAS